MSINTQDLVRVDADNLRTFLANVFKKLNVPADDAHTAAAVLVRADMRGVESHGVNNIRHYVDPLRDGSLNPTPNIQPVMETGVTAVVDGDGGMGLVSGVRAMRLAIDKAKENGAGVVTVNRSRHFGMASYHAMLALEHDMIGVSLTNNASPCVIPTNGLQPMFSTNPISAAVPAGKDIPFVLDMATSVVAVSKIYAALKKGEKIPLGWAVDDTGNLTDEPEVALKTLRALTLGGTPEGSNHKGYGLAVLVDILCGVLSGGIYGTIDQRQPSDDPKAAGSSAHFFLALNVEAFRPMGEFKASMDDMLQALRDSQKVPGEDRIYTHGEKEFYVEQDRRTNGIPYHPSFIQLLRSVAT